MKTYKGVKIPKNNGRPQLWYRGDTLGGLRIIYPNGEVEFVFGSFTYFAYGCTSRANIDNAVLACISYSKKHGSKPQFLGYL